MDKKKVVLLFDGIGEIIDSSVLEKDAQISRMYHEKFEKYRAMAEEEISRYGRNPKDADVVWEWIKKCIYDYCMYQRWKPLMDVSYVLPYSMGLITAIVCLDGISLEDGIKIIISSYCYALDEKEEMMMLMVVGYNKLELQEQIDNNCEKDTVYEAANLGHNYILLSGLKKSLDILSPLLIEGGAIKVNPIMAPVAYHTRFAKRNIDEFAKVIESVEVNDITTPICSLYSKEYISTSKELKDELVINLFSKMKVVECIDKLKEDGNHLFFEIGATRSLYKIFRRIDENIQILKKLD